MTKSDDIRNFRGGVFANPYQGDDKKVVFICSMGLLRSATGARLYAHMYNTRSCGTYSDALTPLSENLICWADELVFVNDYNFRHALRTFEYDEGLVDTIRYKAKVLDIPDDYEHMHPELIKAFEQQYETVSR